MMSKAPARILGSGFAVRYEVLSRDGIFRLSIPSRHFPQICDHDEVESYRVQRGRPRLFSLQKATAKPVLCELVAGELTGFELARLSLVLMQASVADQSPVRYRTFPRPFAPSLQSFLGPLLSGGFIDCAGRGVVESDSVSSLVV